MTYDAFISYAAADGEQLAVEVHRILDEHQVRAYLDKNERIAAGSNVRAELRKTITNARVFVPVLTKEYIMAEWTREEYEHARALGAKVVPVVFGSARTVDWLAQETWFDRNIAHVEISAHKRDGAVGRWRLVESIAPAPYIIARCNEMAATSPEAAIQALDALAAENQLYGLQEIQVKTQRAHFLRLAGRRHEAAELLDTLPVRPHQPLPVVLNVLLTSARLRIDTGDYADARARLAEAAAILSRGASWDWDDAERRRLLAEVTRETARVLLDQAYDRKRDKEINCLSLEVAWSIYLEALALVTVEEDALGHAWVHENLGSLVALYAEYSASRNANIATPEVPELQYRAVSRLCGSAYALDVQSRYHFDIAARLFTHVQDTSQRREGETWTKYHRLKASTADKAAGEASLRAMITELLAIAREFEGITEGQGLAYADLFYAYRALRDFEAARNHADRAVSLINKSEKHADVARGVEAAAREMEESC